jgi:amino acid transporter
MRRLAGISCYAVVYNRIGGKPGGYIPIELKGSTAFFQKSSSRGPRDDVDVKTLPLQLDAGLSILWENPAQSMVSGILGGVWAFAGSRDAGRSWPRIGNRERETAMRFLLRIFSVFFLASAVVAGTADTIQSFAADTPVMTPGITVVEFLAPKGYEKAEAYVGSLPDGAELQRWIERFFSQPAFALFLGFALLFWMLGYKRKKPAGRFAA